MSVKKLPVPAPKDRGAILTDFDVARLLKLDNPESTATRRWVRENVPHKKRVSYQIVRWFERDVMEWLAAQDAA